MDARSHLGHASTQEAARILEGAAAANSPMYLRAAPYSETCSVRAFDTKPDDGKQYLAVYPDDDLGTVSEWVADIFKTTIPPIAEDILKKANKRRAPSYVYHIDGDGAEDLEVSVRPPDDRPFVVAAPGDPLDAVVDRILHLSTN